MVVFFTLLTLGIYPAAWLYGYHGAFNALQSDKKLSKPWIIAAVALSCVSAILTLLAFIVSDPAQVAAVSAINSAPSLFVALIILLESLKARQALDDHYNGSLKQDIKFSKILTFCFTIVYLQHKLNKVLEQKSPAAPAPRA